MVDLVGNQTQPTELTEPDYGFQPGGRKDRSRRICGAGDDHPIQGSFNGVQRLGRELEVDLGATGNLDRLHVQGANCIAVGHVPRTGQGNARSGGKTGGESQDQGRRGPAGQQDLARWQVDPVGFRIVPGKPGLEVLALPVASGIGVEGGMGRRNRPGGRAGGGLTELHVDDAGTPGL